jgi:hypothetical protein
MNCSHPSCRCRETPDAPAVQRDGKPYCSDYCAQQGLRPADKVRECKCAHPACAHQSA